MNEAKRNLYDKEFFVSTVWFKAIRSEKLNLNDFIRIWYELTGSAVLLLSEPVKHVRVSELSFNRCKFSKSVTKIKAIALLRFLNFKPLNIRLFMINFLPLHLREPGLRMAVAKKVCHKSTNIAAVSVKRACNN